MHLLVISLLTILAGTLLLAKFKKEMAGKFFTWISWFFIVVGFILFLGFIGREIDMMKHHGPDGQPFGRHEMMMMNRHHGMWGHFGCGQGMDQRMCPHGPGCMMRDSMMKCCPKRMQCDSATKMPVPKK